MTTILITNDDGVYSAGLRASYEAVKDLGEVYVVAPAVQKSGVGRSISIMEPIRISEIFVNGMKVFAVDGTPTDAVVLGIHKIIGEIPDLTVCGVNLGENLSSEAVTTSGTVCAALEAATQGSQSFAISLEMPEVNKFDLTADFDFSYAQKVLRWIAKRILESNLPEGVDLLNVNVPLRPNGEVEITRLARKMYSVRIERRVDPRGREYYWIYGNEMREADKGTDIWALKNGYVSITPISLDLTAMIDSESIRRWLE